MATGLKEFTDSIDKGDNFTEDDWIELFIYFLLIVQNNAHFNSSLIYQCYGTMRVTRTKNIDKYIQQRIYPESRRFGYTANYLKVDYGYQITHEYEKQLREKFYQKNDVPFSQFALEDGSDMIKPSDIPFSNKDTSKRAIYFAKMYHVFYHLENSIRVFLAQRLSEILGNQWERDLINRIELKKAEAIKREVDLLNFVGKRGDSILYYCMWDDYGRIMKEIPNILPNGKQQDELVAHMNTMTKIRNAIAHNVETIPTQYKKEFEVFLTKYTMIIKSATSN